MLKLMAYGFTAKEIAVQLNVTAKTVDSFGKRMMQKLNLRTRTDIVRYAIEKRWLGPEA